MHKGVATRPFLWDKLYEIVEVGESDSADISVLHCLTSGWLLRVT